MQDNVPTLLQMEQVSRTFPRDFSDTPRAILREMLLPRRLLRDPGPEFFFALQDINISLTKGEKLGVIGSHRSGKSTLAGIAAGMLHPTQGRVHASASRLLLSRPTAGFKPALTLRENLAFRATLGGLAGDALAAAVDGVLADNRISAQTAKNALGNFSPYLVRQLGMELLLRVPAELVVIDEQVSAGAGDARWATRAALLERIAGATSLIISTDFEFLKETTKQSMVLHQGRLYGPFPTELAFEHYLRLPDDYGQDPDESPDDVRASVALSAPLEDIEGATMAQEADELLRFQEAIPARTQQPDDDVFQRRVVKQSLGPAVIVRNIVVDGAPYERSKLRLLRRPGEVLDISVEVLPKKTFVCAGIGLNLHSGNGMEVGSTTRSTPAVQLFQGRPTRIRFHLRIPDLPRYHYGLAMHLLEDGRRSNPANQMKLIVFGLQTETMRETALNLEVTGHSIESESSDEATDLA
ncbi:ATP-binding cassette domain-containing protein [Methyloversatilis thermotolerans]|uniref:ATP-binding cassette domain-containing protein n=1 Tax=Methyloversatilis thermotolerans TaxID=1346290 RepID=UPI00035FB5E6|nr:ATP-binding cassette domain-containing protein [Methyloversatilis thermotolerans]